MRRTRKASGERSGTGERSGKGERSGSKERSGKKTRRRCKGGSTVDKLHASFKDIESKMRSVIERGADERAVIKEIQKEWEQKFQGPISKAAAEGLAKHYRSLYRSTKKTLKQRGGMAPLTHTMGQGTTATEFGNFIVPMNSAAISALGQFPQPSNNTPAGPENSWAAYASSGQAGGAVADGLAIGHVPQSNPAGFLQNAAAALSGQAPPYPSSSPVAPAVSLQTSAYAPYDPRTVENVSGTGPVYAT